MSAKWRAMQHRHRYTYNSVLFPPSFTEVLESSPLSTDPKSAPFFAVLSELPHLTSIYSQVAHSKSLSSSFVGFLSLIDLHNELDQSLLDSASKLYLEVLFLENSLPLHKALLSGLFKVRRKDFQLAICACFRKIFEEHCKIAIESDTRKRFCLSRVALSVLSMPKLHYLVSVVDECADTIALDVVVGLESVVLETEECSRPSPIVLEQCQEGLSCLYYLIQRFPDKFREKGQVVTTRVLNILTRVLSSVSFSRDCFVSAGVSFFAALQVCFSAELLGLFIFQVIFPEKNCSVCRSINSGSVFSDLIVNFPLEDLCSKIRSISTLSRLCLIRGILTAVSRELMNHHFLISGECSNENGGNGVTGHSLVKTILYDAILPELCLYCENPIDSHFNFHALTVMQICLQQVKTSLEGKITNLSENYVPISENIESRILKIIWNNLEDPLSQTVKQVHLIFDLFLDIQSITCWEHRNDSTEYSLKRIAMDLLNMGSRCKGRYVPLALLTKRLGAKSMLSTSPMLLFETIQAYNDDDVCCAATSFLKCFLENLRDQCWDSNGIDKGYTVFRNHCLSPFVCGLASGVSKLRSNLNTYALPVLLEIDIDCIFPMLNLISVEIYGVENEHNHHELPFHDIVLKVEQKIAVLVSLLKVCRALALVEGDIDWERGLVSDTRSDSELMHSFAFLCIKGTKVKVLVEWLVIALTHIDEFLRVDAAESLLLTPKTSSVPSNLELSLLKKAIPLNMRSSSSGFQMKWLSLLRKFFCRVRTALERQHKLVASQSLQTMANFESSGYDENCTERAKNLFSFMRSLSSFLFFSCYPSAPYRRKIMAMELILTMLNVWRIVSLPEVDCGLANPYSNGILSPNFTLLLVGSVVDSWDRLRESSFRILLHFPTPLPGISCEEKVFELISWAKKLVCSPRVRESDAGALILRFIFRRYVIDLGWSIEVTSETPGHNLRSNLVNGSNRCVSLVVYVSSLLYWLTAVVEDGERDLALACNNCFVHGVLLSLRYTFEELDWNSSAVISSMSEMKLLLGKLLDLIMRITSLALSVVSADAWHLPNADDLIDDEVLMMDELDLETESQGDDCSVDPHYKKPREQIIMVGCWLAMKEVSLLLGTIIRKIPLPNASSSGLSQMKTSSPDTTDLTQPIEVLNVSQLKQIGSHFLEVLLKMKHNGAIDKTRAGFTALCNRLLCSNDVRLCRLTESWMEQLMEKTIAKGQVVDDLLRRSAGIPAAFMALFLSEPEGAPKKLLPQALRWLIDVASTLLHEPTDTSVAGVCTSEITSEDGMISTKVYENTGLNVCSKVRKEGVIPTVHAFNVLRACFNDTNLPSDTSGFAADGLILSIRAFSSAHWEVRNSACLAFTALIRRMIGFMNVQKRESARRALTGLEFFHRYPSLHPFIFQELQHATDLLCDGISEDLKSNLAQVVHPSLCPLLILLSRLKPSTLTSESGDILDPFLFLPFIRKCSMQSNMQIRVLASKALTSLVSNEKLPLVLHNIASEFPLQHCKSTSASSFPDGYQNVSFNSMHGMLLQLTSLVDANLRNLADVSKRDKILADLTEVFAKVSWIGNTKLCPCPILNAGYLKVLDHMLSVTRAGQKSQTFSVIRHLLSNLCADCLDMEPSSGLLYHDPCIFEVRKQAAMSYFSCVLHLTKKDSNDLQKLIPSLADLTPGEMIPETAESFPGLLERLVRSISDSSYEVRIATLKWLLRFVNLSERFADGNGTLCHEIGIIRNWMNSNFHFIMVERLDKENHRCVKYILKILFSWNSMFSLKSKSVRFSDTGYVGNLDLKSLDTYWDKLVAMYTHTRHPKVIEALICCLATCVNHYSSLLTCYILSHSVERTSDDSQLQAAIKSFERLNFFVGLIKLHSSSSETVNMRRAVAESVIASGLLEQAEPISRVTKNGFPPFSSSFNFSSQNGSNIYGNLVLDAWFTCIKLLEDEDDVIRQRLSVSIQKRLPIGTSIAGAPFQVEKVIKLSFDYLSTCFGNWIHYFDFLSQWVYDAANYVPSNNDLVRQVFDKEIDNHHEEKLYICQICCLNLETLPISKSWMSYNFKSLNFKQHLYDWRSKFWRQSIYFSKVHEQRLEEYDWIGGVGNHKDAFLPLYANLLGFYALSTIIFLGDVEEGSSLLNEVVELGRSVSPFLTNSFISSLYVNIVKLHEKKLGTTVKPIAKLEHEPLWENFEPYFLIK